MRRVCMNCIVGLNLYNNLKYNFKAQMEAKIQKKALFYKEKEVNLLEDKFSRIFISLESFDGKQITEKLDISLDTPMKEVEKLTN